MNTWKTIQTHCTECKSDKVYHDPIHNITFCNNCGLILIDNTKRTYVTEVIRETREKESRLRKCLWHRRITHKKIVKKMP